MKICVVFTRTKVLRIGVPVYPNYVYLSKIASQSYLIRLYDSECI